MALTSHYEQNVWIEPIHIGLCSVC